MHSYLSQIKMNNKDNLLNIYKTDNHFTLHLLSKFINKNGAY